jgi:hypothetical protein
MICEQQRVASARRGTCAGNTTNSLIMPSTCTVTLLMSWRRSRCASDEPRCCNAWRQRDGNERLQPEPRSCGRWCRSSVGPGTDGHAPNRDPSQAHAERLEGLLRKERAARVAAEEALQRLREAPPKEPPKKAKGRVNFNPARPWLRLYKAQRVGELENIEEDDQQISSQMSSAGDARTVGGTGGAAAQALPRADSASSNCGGSQRGSAELARGQSLRRTLSGGGLETKDSGLRSGPRGCAFTRAWCVLMVLAAIAAVATVATLVGQPVPARQALSAQLLLDGARGNLSQTSFDLEVWITLFIMLLGREVHCQCAIVRAWPALVTAGEHAANISLGSQDRPIVPFGLLVSQ